MLIISTNVWNQYIVHNALSKLKLSLSLSLSGLSLSPSLSLSLYIYYHISYMKLVHYQLYPWHVGSGSSRQAIISCAETENIHFLIGPSPQCRLLVKPLEWLATWPCDIIHCRLVMTSTYCYVQRGLLWYFCQYRCCWNFTISGACLGASRLPEILRTLSYTEGVCTIHLTHWLLVDLNEN